jgi:hypothetical protein
LRCIPAFAEFWVQKFELWLLMKKFIKNNGFFVVWPNGVYDFELSGAARRECGGAETRRTPDQLTINNPISLLNLNYFKIRGRRGVHWQATCIYSNQSLIISSSVLLLNG